MDIRIQCLCVDSPDPKKIASFWEAALGWRRTFDEVDQVCLEPPEGSPEDGIVPDLLFLRVPEGNWTVAKALGSKRRRLSSYAEPTRRACHGYETRSRPSFRRPAVCANNGWSPEGLG